jgi:hypothetical protein
MKKSAVFISVTLAVVLELSQFPTPVNYMETTIIRFQIQWQLPIALIKPQSESDITMCKPD